jgi:hypothetical protein
MCLLITTIAYAETTQQLVINNVTSFNTLSHGVLYSQSEQLITLSQLHTTVLRVTQY